MIGEDVLLAFDARIISLKKGETLFYEGDTARYFYQVKVGEIKMNNFNDEGKEFIQSIFTAGNSFGEPPLFINKPYPANAVAITDTQVYALAKEVFFELLLQNPQVHLSITENLAQRLYFKSVMASEISSQEPEHRILKLIDYFKENVNRLKPSDKYKVELTRQQIADLTGLRVETVIRSIKALEKKGLLIIEDRKVYR
ncbi:cyclic nucleotide-binding domain-containing protein [Flavobacterium sp. Sd200]|uniref:Crp/Fnr family transcriptional regulator n=1 Tax=Flavobacterium sp. Sd200 TaxID=2692211 RepID=UPI0013701982|nr:Crp/Fnr family transcriptional regulator [Flavobacterium sp. Sd200]MXN91427.1 cyclic nucleotide-binding domain-containing protein [Flavobacterium sp. Sd200]